MTLVLLKKNSIILILGLLAGSFRSCKTQVNLLKCLMQLVLQLISLWITLKILLTLMRGMPMENLFLLLKK
jgi:hypothetical protein